MSDLTSRVYATLAKHYPEHVLGWVRRATWQAHPGVPLSKIDMSRRPGGRDPAKVQGIAEAVKAGKPMPPVVLVDTGEPKLQVADGYHRTLGFAHAGKSTVPALIASGVGAHGPWEKRMHDAKLNLTAEHTCAVDLAGVCTGPGPCDTGSFGTGNNWVNRAGGLPPYIKAIAHSLVRDHGMTESRAISTAVATVKRWASGVGNVTAETRARAAAAAAAWEALKVKAHALTAAPAATVDLTGPHGYSHGWVRLDADAPTAVERATRAVMTDGHALLHGPAMVTAAQRTVERLKASGRTARVRRVDVSGVPHILVGRAADLTAGGTSAVDLAFTEQLHPRGAKGTSVGGKFVAKGSAGSAPAGVQANTRDFQRRHGLAQTGRYDAATKAAVAKAMAPKTGGGKSAKTAAKAARTATASAINRLSQVQRAKYRILKPTPPPGYHWTHDNRLVRSTPQSRAVRRILAGK